MEKLKGASIHVSGIVQGVGFRPFIYGLAQKHALKGWVRNTSAGVDIEVDGVQTELEAFIEGISKDAPPLARIDGVQISDREPNGFATFEIVSSKPQADAFQPISPDIGICEDCLRELFDPKDFRYRYPFINCTNCGPRFTIIEDIPYDRPQTTMATFDMCAQCEAEYSDPTNRRFHAQPVACPECGPRLWLEGGGKVSAEKEKALQAARDLLREGKIVAVKGLGGFHLACDATNPEAVSELRRRKLRVDKPYALMMPDLATIEKYCVVGKGEKELLASRERPIVILERKAGTGIAKEVAPGQHTLAVMLPYTPLHYLLLDPSSDFPNTLVMTSGNLSEEPIAYENQDARERLGGLADAFLMHDRDIHMRCDDSVVRSFEDGDKKSIYFIRRSRGYAPNPVRLAWDSPPILATGTEQKNTFCLTRERYAFLSHHIGEMENYETLRSFEDGIEHYERLFRIQPEVIAYDLHPDYLATRYALERAEKENLVTVGVQHHHAHIAACMAEHGLTGEKPVVGLSFDGTGYGEDGAIWGGEVMIADYLGYERPIHLRYVGMPGGEAAVRESWRMALAWLREAGVAWDEDLAPVEAAGEEARGVVESQFKQGINVPQTSSMGRLFDAVASVIGVRQAVNYQAQAAIELEAIVDKEGLGIYPIAIQDGEIDPRPMFGELVADLRGGVSRGKMAAKFHNGLVRAAIEVCQLLRRDRGLKEVALSGGVWQNMALLRKVVDRLQKDGFTVYIHREAPANDGGVALGQAAIAAHRLRA